MQTNKQVYISLPVADLNTSTEFYRKLGFTKQDDWSMEGQVSCMMWSENIYVMLCVKDLFQTYINGRTIVTPKEHSHALPSLTMGSREEVDEKVKIVMENGGSHYVYNSGMDFMYNIMIEDLDGHVFELAYMDMSKMTQN